MNVHQMGDVVLAMMSVETQMEAMSASAPFRDGLLMLKWIDIFVNVSGQIIL